MLLEQIYLALTPLMIGTALLGVTLGIIWGALPGLSTTMAMALLIALLRLKATSSLWMQMRPMILMEIA